MKNLLIVGANSDIAIATAKHYAKHGYALMLAARNTGALEPLIGDLSIRGAPSVELFELDVTDSSSHKTFFEQLTTPVSGVLVACGYLGDQTQAQTDQDEFLRIVNTNFVGLAQLINEFANRFEQAGSGFIIGITSVAGDRGRKSNYAYGSAKAGFSAYLAGLRNRLFSAGVHVLEVRPGFVNTKMTEDLDLPPLLTAEAEEVAKAIYQAQTKGKNLIYVKPMWRLIMMVIKNIPETIFKRLNL